MATLDSPAPVNLVRSIFLCNIFNFFFSASKACLIPFLTIYLKMLGLSATQTGFIMGIKTLVSLIFAPLWSKCAVRCGKRRFMLMFSLFVMAVTYLSLGAVPSIDPNTFASRCAMENNNQHINISKTPVNGESESFALATTKIHEPAVTTTVANIPSEKSSLTKNLTPGLNLTKVTATSGTADQHNNTSDGQSESKLEANEKSNEKVTTVKKTTVKTTAGTTTVLEKESTEDDNIVFILKQILKEMGNTDDELNGLTEYDLIKIMNEKLETKSGRRMLSDALGKLPKTASQKLFEILNQETTQRRKRAVDEDDETKAAPDKSILSSWKVTVLNKLKEFRDQIRNTENEIFIVVLVVLMVGETMSCPVEKLADDGWFEFLESIDDLEKYGMQRVWSSFAYILFPVIVTLSIDNTRCLFGLSIHPFMLHFYLFGGLLGLTLLIAFFYPMATSDKYKYASKVMKGMRTVCCNGRSLMFTITLLIMGIVYSSYYNFLFWLLLDLGSKEVTLGLCLTMAALAEIPMLLFNDKLVKKIGSGGVVSLSLLFLSARCLYYSFLTTPWAVIPAELMHAFTHTAMWWAILSSPSFNTSPALSRSIRSILSSVYFGVGFACGSIISGVVYDVYGVAILFQAGAILSIGWFPFLCLGVRCCKERDRTEVKYARLLASDDASDDTDSMEDDWLEQALKDK